MLPVVMKSPTPCKVPHDTELWCIGLEMPLSAKQIQD